MINYPNSFVMSAGESIYSMPRQLVQYAMSYNEGKTVPRLVLVEGYAVIGTMIGEVNSIRDYKVGDKTAWELLLSYNLPGNVDLLDPALTVTLPPYQTACGALDAISHLVEPFFFSDEATFGNLALHDHMQIGVIRAIYENLGKVLANPADLQLRGLMQWSATVGLNGWLTCGVQGWLTCGVQGWTPMHQMGHVLSSHFKATHGATLACMMVAWMRFFANRADNTRFVKLASLLFGYRSAARRRRRAGSLCAWRWRGKPHQPVWLHGGRSGHADRRAGARFLRAGWQAGQHPAHRPRAGPAHLRAGAVRPHMPIRRTVFGGLAAVELITPQCRLIAVTELGPRIAWFSRPDGPNLLYWQPEGAARGSCTAATACGSRAPWLTRARTRTCPTTSPAA